MEFTRQKIYQIRLLFYFGLKNLHKINTTKPLAYKNAENYKIFTTENYKLKLAIIY